MGKKSVVAGKVNQRNLPALDDPGLSKKSLFRIDEVSAYFCVSRSTIYLWVDHGILGAEKYNGTIRIPREAILTCRFNNQMKPLD